MPISGVDPNAFLRYHEQKEMIQHPTDIQQAFDPNGIQASMARGNNVYMGGLPSAPGAGRPRNPTLVQGDATSPAMQQALQNRIANYRVETNKREARG